MGQSCGESRICGVSLIWEQATLAMLIVELCFLYLGGWRREGNLGSVQVQGLCCCRAGPRWWYPKWGVRGESLRCQKEIAFVISLLSFRISLLKRMF